MGTQSHRTHTVSRDRILDSRPVLWLVILLLISSCAAAGNAPPPADTVALSTAESVEGVAATSTIIAVNPTLQPTSTTTSTQTPQPTATASPTAGATRDPIRGGGGGGDSGAGDDDEMADGESEGEYAEEIEVAFETDTVTPTRLPATNSPVSTSLANPTIIADARLQIRDNVSGQIFGDGTISLYAPDAITNEQSVRIELELDLANIYITPTPAGAITSMPVPTRITATPPTHNIQGTPIPTPTERFPIHEESGIQFYQRMGASLFCPPQTFAGCDDERDESQAKIVSMTTTRFNWLLTQSNPITGVQDLNIELWAVFPNLDGALEYVTQWEYPFTIEVVPDAPTTSSIGGIVGVLLVTVLALTGVAGITIQRNRRGKSKRFDLGRRDKPRVFISYQRKPSWSLARSISNSLTQRGADVFLDVDDINEGRFEEMIQQALENCDYFVLILAPTTLESKWVQREIELAIKLKKVIIPMATDGFDFYAADLPEGLEELSSHNAITITPEFFEAAIDRLATRFLKLGDE